MFWFSAIDLFKSRNLSWRTTLRVKLSLIISTGLLGLAFPALAQEPEEKSIKEPDEIILVTGARVPVPVTKYTGSASVLDEKQILARGDEFVTDALRRIPGVAVNRSGPVGALTQVRLRGSEANQVLVLIDGIEASDPFSGSFGFSSLTSAGVQRIEILRGEQSALWGTDAIGGVIQILTEPDKQGESLETRFEAGSLQTRSGSLDAAKVRGQTKLWLNLSGMQTAGYDVSGQNGEQDGFSQLSASGGINYDIGANWAVKLRGRSTKANAQFDSDTDFDGRLNDTLSELDSDLSLGRIALVGNSLNDRLTNEISASYLRSTTRSGGNTSIGQRTRLGWQISTDWETGSIQHRLTGIIEGRFETYQNDGGAGSGINQRQESNQVSGAFDYQADRGPVTFSVSARHDQNDLFENANAFRAGLAWNIAATNSKIHASAGQGVKNPGFFELFGYFPAFFVGNPNLKPEKSTGFELGWVQGFSNGSASVTVFSSELQNEIYTDFGAFPATARNRANNSTREGVELAADINLSRGLGASGSMSFLRSQEAGVQEIRRPNFMASFSVFWSDPAENWQIALGLDQNGKMTDIDFSTFQTVTLPAYTLLRGKISRRVSDKLNIYVRGENLSNSRYTEVVGYRAQERTLYGGISAQF